MFTEINIFCGLDILIKCVYERDSARAMYTKTVENFAMPTQSYNLSRTFGYESHSLKCHCVG